MIIWLERKTVISLQALIVEMDILSRVIGNSHASLMIFDINVKP